MRIIEASHDLLGEYRLYCKDADELLFTENESNAERLWQVSNAMPFVKDSINDYVVHGNKNAINPACVGTKAAALYKIDVPPGESRIIRLRIKRITQGEKSFRAFMNFYDLFTECFGVNNFITISWIIGSRAIPLFHPLRKNANTAVILNGATFTTSG
jgi:hypothetical protein